MVSFPEHFSEAGDLKKCGLYEIREQQVFCDIIGGQEHLVICGGGHVSMPVINRDHAWMEGHGS